MSQKGIELDISVQGTDKQKSIMVGDQLFLGFGQNAFFPIGAGASGTTESQKQTPFPRKGKIVKAILAIQSNTINGVATITLKRNGVNATPLLQFLIPATNSVDQESAVEVEFELKDLAGWEIDTLGSTGANSFKLSVIIELEAS